jgi:hypothetical protein
MRRYFRQASVSEVHWIYVVDIAAPIGRETPQIEYVINNLTIESLDELARTMATPDLELTAKGVDRMLSYEGAELARLFGVLPPRRRAGLLELVTNEGRYRAPGFRKKIELLRAFCSADDTVPGTR